MNNISQKTTEKVLKILNEEVVPAQGCTEPIAIAYVAAKAREVLGCDKVEKITIKVSGNMIKNVKSVVVPNSGGLTGIEVAAVMGFLYGDATKDLMVISSITKDQMKNVIKFIKENEIKVVHEDTDVKLYACIEAKSKECCACVEIKHLHTNITKIKKDDQVILLQPCNDHDFNSPQEDRNILSIKLIYDMANTIKLHLIDELFSKVITLNSQIAKEGLSGTYGVNIGKVIKDNIESGFYGDDIRNRAASFASAGSDARMSGCALPVMTTSGSGNQGMAASLAIIEYANIKKLSHESLIRALFFSHLATVHIKTNVGRLSAYCGVICSAAAVSGALCLLNNKSYKETSRAIANTLGDVSGIICDGAKSSCAMKIATTIYAAFDSFLLATDGKYLHKGDGIIGKDIEDTLSHIGKLSNEGMLMTDKVIIDIMSES
jgi:L-cysteine desulfidase